MNVQQLTRNFGGMINKNTPSILTGLGVAGLFATTVLAVKATPKALSILEDERSEIHKTWDGPLEEIELTAQDVLKLTWKCYLPAAIMGAVTIGCMIGANKVNLNRNAALVGLYSLSEKALKEYQAKVVETMGISKHQKVKDEITKDKIINNPVANHEIINTGKGNTLCYDSLSGRYFLSDIEHIRQILNKASRDLISETFMTVNNVYSELGLRNTDMGDNVGWHINDGLIEPYFSSQLTENGTPCLVLDYEVAPRYGFNEY